MYKNELQLETNFVVINAPVIDDAGRGSLQIEVMFAHHGPIVWG
jgi:hypothetical protein